MLDVKDRHAVRVELKDVIVYSYVTTLFSKSRDINSPFLLFQPASLALCLSRLFSASVGSLLPPLDLCITPKIEQQA
jgi:hypothetical protein